MKTTANKLTKFLYSNANQNDLVKILEKEVIQHYQIWFCEVQKEASFENKVIGIIIKYTK